MNRIAASRLHPTHWLICAQVLSAMKMETVCAASVDGVASGGVEATSELGYMDNVAAVGRLKFDFHTGERRQRRDGRCLATR